MAKNANTNHSGGPMKVLDVGARRSTFLGIARQLERIGVGQPIPGGIVQFLRRRHLEPNWSSYLQAAGWITVDNRVAVVAKCDYISTLNTLFEMYDEWRRKPRLRRSTPIVPATTPQPVAIAITPEIEEVPPSEPQPATNQSNMELRLQSHLQHIEPRKRVMLHRRESAVIDTQPFIQSTPRRNEVDLNDLLQRVAKLPTDVMGRIDWRAVESPQLVGMIRKELERLIPANGVVTITGKAPLFIWAMAGRIAGYRHCTLICSNGHSSIRV